VQTRGRAIIDEFVLLLRLPKFENIDNDNKKSKTERRDQRDDHIALKDTTPELHWRRSLHHPTRKTVLWLTVMSSLSLSQKKIFRLRIDVRMRSKHTIHALRRVDRVADRTAGHSSSRAGQSNGLDGLDAFPRKSVVTESYADVCFHGCLWRITVRSDLAFHYLCTMQDPTPAAGQLLADLGADHLVSPKHHALVHAVFTKHSSSSAVVRLAKRWLSAHLLVIPFEGIELMVCHVYC
jgi:hypothetical protein